jgi:hypothetical protein
MVETGACSFVRAHRRRIRYCLLFLNIAATCTFLLTRMNKSFFFFPPCSSNGSSPFSLRFGNISVTFIISPNTIGLGRDIETGLLISGTKTRLLMMGPSNLACALALDLLFWSSRSRVFFFSFFIFVGDGGLCWGYSVLHFSFPGSFLLISSCFRCFFFLWHAYGQKMGLQKQFTKVRQNG